MTPPPTFDQESENESVVLPVLGMTCSACQHHVESALAAISGVSSARVDLMRHRAWVEFDPARTGPRALVEAIRESGYDAVLPRSNAGATSIPEPSGAGLKAALTIAAGLLAMLFAMPLQMASQPSRFDNWIMGAMPWLYTLPTNSLRWTLLLITGLLAVWAGSPIYRSAWKALLHRETNMNTLVSLGTSVAFLYSAYATVFPGHGEIYFDSVLLILGFLLLGKWLEGRARHTALAAVDALAQLLPATARIRRENGEAIVPLDQVKINDLVVILPGERIPVDGLIESGRTTVDESMLTGESIPLERNIGERVLAGSVNYDGVITARVESAGEGTTLSQIARLVEQAQGSRAPMERLADRASAVFVPVVLGLAVLTFLGWLLFAHSLTLAIAATVAVLVIACPCAMGLAVPAALTVAIGRGAQFGVLIKGGEALERIAKLQAIVMDKTGTLTLGRPSLLGVKTLGNLPDSELLRIAAAAEDHSAHPLAHAIVAAAQERNLIWPLAADVQVIPGRGLSATVEGKALLLGNLELMREWSVSIPDSASTEAEPGVTRLWMALDGTLAGYFDAKDSPRQSAKAAIAWLRKEGFALEMLTGDSATAAESIAKAVGIRQVSANLMPGDKVTRIRLLQSGGVKIGMVGDGINDAAALAQGDAGMAMGTGAAIAQEAGDVLLLKSDPLGICTAIALSRATVRVMHQNLGWAAGYNLIGIPVAAGLLYPAFHLMLTPWMAAAAMAFSSVSVLLNSLRLRSWQTPRIAG